MSLLCQIHCLFRHEKPCFIVAGCPDGQGLISATDCEICEQRTYREAGVDVFCTPCSDPQRTTPTNGSVTEAECTRSKCNFSVNVLIHPVVVNNTGTYIAKSNVVSITYGSD